MIQTPMGPEDLPKGVEKRFASYPDVFAEEANEGIKKWFYGEYVPQGLANGAIIPTTVEKVEGSLKGVQGALDKMIKSVSGKKLVADPHD